jgi:hypothetical protein
VSENPFTDLAKADVAKDREMAKAQVRFLGSLLARPRDPKVGEKERLAQEQSRDALIKELIASAP